MLDDSRALRVARWRYTWLRYDPAYQEVRELMQALDVLAEPKLTKAMAFLGQPEGRRVRTNNHVERFNRKLRYEEKARYKWRKRRTTVRFLVLLPDRYWRRERAIRNRWHDESPAAFRNRSTPGSEVVDRVA